ncbi:MAG TPA: HEAT repeat domain-containing protein [Myxococcaceae bacterium]|jgi:hypothetical protein
MAQGEQDSLERIALGEGASETEAREVARARGWRLTHDVPGNAEGPRELVWAAEGGAAVHFYDDPPVLYMVVEGSPAQVRALADAVRASLPVFGYNEAARAVGAGGSPDQLKLALRRTAVAAPSRHDPRFFELLLSGLRHADARVRAGTVFALSYVGWPAFRPELERLAQADPDAEVRANAARLLKAYMLYGVTNEKPDPVYTGRPDAPGGGAVDGKDGADAAPPAAADGTQRPARRLVLSEHVDLDELRTFANEQGWTEVGEQKEDPYEYIPFQVAWRTADGAAGVHYIEDWHIRDGNEVLYTPDVPFLILQGDGLPALESRLRDALPIYDDADIRALVEAADDEDDRIEAITLAAYAAPARYDPVYARFFTDGLAHPNPWVRLASVYAAGGVQWPELAPALRHTADTDSLKDAREVAEDFITQSEHPSTRWLIDVFGEDDDDS